MRHLRIEGKKIFIYFFDEICHVVFSIDGNVKIFSSGNFAFLDKAEYGNVTKDTKQRLHPGLGDDKNKIFTLDGLYLPFQGNRKIFRPMTNPHVGPLSFPRSAKNFRQFLCLQIFFE